MRIKVKMHVLAEKKFVIETGDIYINNAEMNAAFCIYIFGAIQPIHVTVLNA